MAIADPLNSRQHFAYVGRLVIRRAERVLGKKAEVVVLKNGRTENPHSHPAMTYQCSRIAHR
jgi:hypothetical protein